MSMQLVVSANINYYCLRFGNERLESLRELNQRLFTFEEIF